MINTTSNWLRFGAFLRGPAESTRRCADSTSRLPGDGYGCHAHAKSEHGEPWRYTIRGVSSAGMTSGALHARENANMPPRESHGRLGPIGKTDISITASSISSHSLTAVLVPLTTDHWPLTTGHCSPATRHYLLRPYPAGYCLTPTADLPKTERDPISTNGHSIFIMSPNRAIPAEKSNRSSPLATAPPLTILSWPETLNASGSRRACRMAIRRNACSLLALPDFPEFAQAVRFGVPGTPGTMPQAGLSSRAVPNYLPEHRPISYDELAG